MQINKFKYVYAQRVSVFERAADASAVMTFKKRERKREWVGGE